MYCPGLSTTYSEAYAWYASNGYASFGEKFYAKKSPDGKTISWYYTYANNLGGEPQWNEIDRRYDYLAIG